LDTYHVVLYIHLLSLFVGIGAASVLIVCLFQLRGARELMEAVPWGMTAGKIARLFPIAKPTPNRVDGSLALVARRWRDSNNTVLREAAGRHPQVAFVDWAALVASHPGILGPDGVHPGPRGRALLAGAVADAVHR